MKETKKVGGHDFWQEMAKHAGKACGERNAVFNCKVCKKKNTVTWYEEMKCHVCSNCGEVRREGWRKI